MPRLDDDDGCVVPCSGLAAIDLDPSGDRSLMNANMRDDSNEMRYYASVIVSFVDRDTEALAAGRRVRRFVSIEKVARRKLRQLEIAGRLDDLRVPPGNRLEALKGGRQGQMSIRINDQWRVCFTWTAAGPADVEIVDYH
jgi:proteic killer suppression protein